VDIGHHGWLGWSSNLGPAADLIATTIKGATGGANTVAGFISNTANSCATVEPYFQASTSVGGTSVRQSKWVDWNDYVDEQSYDIAMLSAFTSRGMNSSIGMLIDTSRNGWGGSARPTAASTSTSVDTFVNASRIDRRIHAGNWCNQSGAGIGERPKAVGTNGIHAYVWIKPPGESDGSSSQIPQGSDNPDGKGYDRMCDPTYTGNARNGNNSTGALSGAPVSGRWFSAQFQELMKNAYPVLSDVVGGGGGGGGGVVGGGGGGGGGATDISPPSAPANLQVTAIGSTSIGLAWSASTDNIGVTAYNIYNGSNLAGTVSSTSATVQNLLPSTSYTFTVKARDAMGNTSQSSAAVTVTTSPTGVDISPPSAPSNLTWNASGMTVTLSWGASTDNTGVTGYQLYYGSFFLGVFSDTSLALIGFKTGTPYAFSVKAVDAAGNVSVASNTATVLLQAGMDTTPPTAPSGLTVTNTTDKTVSLRWTASSDDVGVVVYQIYVGSSLSGTVPAATSVTISTLQPTTIYSFTVKAVDGAGNVSQASGAVTATTKASADVTAPTVSLSASASTITAASTLALSASASDSVGVTKVEFYDGSTLLGSVTSTPYTLSVSITAASNGTHSFTARAYDAAGNVGISSAVSVTVSISTGGGGGGGGGSTGAPVYTAANGKFLKDGSEIKLFGLNWFGLETPDRVLHGLWTGRQLSAFLSDFKSKGFNALRIPVSPETINSGYAISTAAPGTGEDGTALKGKDGRTALEYSLQKMQAAGMYVLLDFHTCNSGQLGSSEPGTPIACSGYSMDKWLTDMKTLATLSKTYTNVIGIDLFNEPWNLTWSTWASYASQAGQAVLGVNPNLTIWVEGVASNSTAGGYSVNWGANLYEAGAISGISNSKLVYAPHLYGPSVAPQSYFNDGSFPNNMPTIWDTVYGHLIGQGYTVIVGEYGGMYTGTDKTWEDAFVTYMIGKGTKSSFYWCVNPNSGDTGGIYTDSGWSTWDTGKLALLQRLMQ